MKKQILPALLVAAFALGAAEVPSDAKTYALVVGISKYQKLPQDLWLRSIRTRMRGRSAGTWPVRGEAEFRRIRCWC